MMTTIQLEILTMFDRYDRADFTKQSIKNDFALDLAQILTAQEGKGVAYDVLSELKNTTNTEPEDEGRTVLLQNAWEIPGDESRKEYMESVGWKFAHTEPRKIEHGPDKGGWKTTTEPELTVHEWEHMSEEDKQTWCDSHPDCFPHYQETHMMKLTPEQRDMNYLWENGIPHHKKSLEIFSELLKIDIENGNVFDWRWGGDGDNGEMLLYELDIYFTHTEPELTVHEWEHMSEEDKQTWCDSHPDCFPNTEPERYTADGFVGGGKSDMDNPAHTEPEDRLADWEWDDIAKQLKRWGITLEDIALRKIEEFIAEFPANKNLTVGFYVALMKERLQQEDK